MPGHAAHTTLGKQYLSAGGAEVAEAAFSSAPPRSGSNPSWPAAMSVVTGPWGACSASCGGGWQVTQQKDAKLFSHAGSRLCQGPNPTR